MALAKKPAKPIINPQQPAKARDDVYRSAVVDEQYNSQIGLVNYASGYSVECDYYEQILGRDDEQSSFQANRDIAEQQYRRIRHYPIKLMSSLTPSYDNGTARFQSEGTCILPAVSVPLLGNMLLISGLDHRIAVYTITRITPKNISLAPAYECDISFQRILDEKQLIELEAKIVEDTLYDQDQLKHGKHPVMATEKYNRKYDYLRRALGLCHAYYHEFYSRELNTLLVPGQDAATYDPWCVNAFTKLWSSLEGKPSWNFGRLNVDDSQEANAISVFEWVMDGRREDEARLTVKFTLLSTKRFYQYPAAGGIRFSGARFCMWPATTSLGEDVGKELAVPENTPPTNPLVANLTSMEYGGVPLFPSVADDPYYVFTEAFYRNQAPMTIIESMVRDMVDEKAISHPALKQMVDAIPLLSPLDRYYFTPFVIMLLRAGAIEP